jgi:putative Mg2+ transporter-C (MgtC) family protein
MDFFLRFGAPMDLAQIGGHAISLVLAAVLGGIIGVERELRGKAAGLRTQLFICMGSAFFTILSGEVARVYGGDHTRIAAQIIPGIGFIGAGSILHSRGSITGLTTAASLFVVASIGMAAGSGFYLLAILVTVLALIALFLFGWLEARWLLRPLQVTYDVFGGDLEQMLAAVTHILDDVRLDMHSVQFVRTGEGRRLQFVVQAASNEQCLLLDALRIATVFDRVQSTAQNLQ